MNDWQFIDSRNNYAIYRKIVNGYGKWKAVKDGKEKEITYDQARGYEPLDNEEALQMELGKLLLPMI